MKKKIRALVLFSGGLDSTLAVKVLEKQNIEVEALSFVSYFFDDAKAKLSAEKNKIKMRSVDFSEIHCEVVKKPKRGYGSAMNPCIDCHLLMIREAGKIMKEEDFDFVATGEILGQRPMSQNLKSLKLIERKADLEGRLLRPLSAKLLEETEVEKKGLVDRGKLLDISGRSRKRQFELAKELGVEYYPNPGGGCILTEVEFGIRLKKMFAEKKDPSASDYELIKFGRIFWIDGNMVIIGKNNEQNEKLRTLKEKGDILVEMEDFSGPVALIRGKDAEKAMPEIKEKVAGYSKHVKGMDYKDLKFIIKK